MESFKIEHYEREHGLGSFPKFRTLSDTEAHEIFVAIRQAVGLNNATPLELVLAIDSMAVMLDKRHNADRDDFNLLNIIHELELPSSDQVYLNWYRYDRIDIININDLAINFDDIWYPVSDDLDVIDQEMRWLLSIAHDGMVSWLSLTDSSEVFKNKGQNSKRSNEQKCDE